MLSLADIATQLNVFKALSLALPRFYKKTNISAKLVFAYNEASNEFEAHLGFLPHEPTEAEYRILFDEIIDAEKLLSNEYVLNSASNYETIGQLIFKHRESTNQIIARHKEELK